MSDASGTSETVDAADAAETDAPITFYRLQACPYCERVARRLREYDLEYRSRFVEPLHSRRNAVKRVAGVRAVPVVVDETTGVTMAESANIVDYLESTYGDGADVETDGGTARDDGGDD
ncbi:glutathione S-transferase N-terminal domain-containing protein [Natrialbaceae archaeon GCM10025810]|uniref:glutathione S-transferase N-terminal domain-containing protein n=1 Tax=Halovalidus salilacus TaxID=3075124 RepID=UPI003609C701